MSARKARPSPDAPDPASLRPSRLSLALPGYPNASACCERTHASLLSRLARGYSPAQLAHAYTPPHLRPCPYCNDTHPLTHGEGR